MTISPDLAYNTQSHNGLQLTDHADGHELVWNGPLESIVFDEEGIRAGLRRLDLPCYVVSVSDRIGLTNLGNLYPLENKENGNITSTASALPLLPQQLGNPDFMSCHGVKYAYASGAMANGIASEELVIRMGSEKLLSSFGAAGLMPTRIEAAIARIQQELPQGPYAFNLIHSPSEEELERRAVELYLKHGITTVEASAFLALTPHVVRYRAAGLSLNRNGQIEIKNKIIAKSSRREVASQFLQPAPEAVLRQLVEQKLITEQQASLAGQVPMADDITVEADSGGHTDNRPLVSLLPSMIALRNEFQEKFRYPTIVRVGAAGGIGTPESALAAFMMGAEYVVSGSVNQSCVEAAASRHTKILLAQAATTDVMMAYIDGRRLDLGNRHKALYAKYREKFLQLGLIPAETETVKRETSVPAGTEPVAQ